LFSYTPIKMTVPLTESLISHSRLRLRYEIGYITGDYVLAVVNSDDMFSEKLSPSRSEK